MVENGRFRKLVSWQPNVAELHGYVQFQLVFLCVISTNTKIVSPIVCCKNTHRSCETQCLPRMHSRKRKVIYLVFSRIITNTSILQEPKLSGPRIKDKDSFWYSSSHPHLYLRSAYLDTTSTPWIVHVLVVMSFELSKFSDSVLCHFVGSNGSSTVPGSVRLTPNASKTLFRSFWLEVFLMPSTSQLVSDHLSAK